VTSLVLFNVTSASRYSFKVAAYNRQGIGPLSSGASVKVDGTIASAPTTTVEPPTFADQAHSPFDVATAANNSEVAGFDLVVQVSTFLGTAIAELIEHQI